jgi:hypothetical protein
MIKRDEIELMRLVLSNEENTPAIPSALWGSLTKRQYYLLEKWAYKGWWEYGVSSRSGWLTPEGKKALRKVIEEKGE